MGWLTTHGSGKHNCRSDWEGWWAYDTRGEPPELHIGPARRMHYQIYLICTPITGKPYSDTSVRSKRSARTTRTLDQNALKRLN